jgi:two-component system, OmpR family, sensor histidine kinase VanS
MTSRPRGVSVRVRLTLSYVALVMIAGGLLLAVVYVFLLRYVPTRSFSIGPFSPTRDDLITAFAPPAAWAMLALLVFALIGGWIVAGWMLSPLRRITHATRIAAAGSLAHRIALDGREDEFRELADSFDAMLERLEAQVSEQQRFAANASHELRTPLAITQTLLDVAHADPAHDIDRLVERLRSVNRRAIDLTEALLLLSRADQRAFAREEVDLSLLADEAAEVLLPLAEERGVAIAVSGGVAVTSGSRALLLQLTTNLLHNAIVHNVGDERRVEVRTSATGGRAELVVANTGVPLSPELAATLVEPFQRGSERVRGDHAGVGLGLAIVQSIVRAHDGTLDVAARPGGGLRVAVRLTGA